MAIEEGMFGLNLEQMRFLENILMGMPRIEAYMDVYSELTNRQSASKLAARILKKDGAKKYLHKRREELIFTEGLTREKLVSELAKIAFINITDIFKQDENGGVVLKEFYEMSQSAKAAIAGLEYSSSGFSEYKKTNTKIKLSDKLRAIELLVKIMGFDLSTANPLLKIEAGVVLLPDVSVEKAPDIEEDIEDPEDESEDDSDDHDGPR